MVSNNKNIKLNQVSSNELPEKSQEKKIIDGIKITEGYKLPQESYQPLLFIASYFLEDKDAFKLFSLSKDLYNESKVVRNARKEKFVADRLDINNESICKVVNKKLSKEFGYYKDVPKVHPEKLDARILEECLRAVTLGEEKLAKALLELRPECLLEDTVEVSRESNIGNPIIAYSGKEFKNITPFQIAICEGDVAMAEMMIPFFKELTKWEEQELPNGETKEVKLFDGEAEMQKQFNAIFPNGDVDKIMQQLETAANQSKLIDDIFTAIKNAPDNEVNAILNKDYANAGELGEELARFKLDFDKLSNSGIIFNPYHLYKAYQKYGDNYDNLGGDWDSTRNQLAWRQVVGYVQSRQPACLLQDSAYGIYNIAKKNVARKDLPRSLEFRGSRGFFAVLGDSNSVGLGVNYGAVFGRLYADAASGDWVVSTNAVENERNLLGEIISSKNFSLGQIYLACGKTPNSTKVADPRLLRNFIR